jgi:hypothetical protein
MVAGHQVSCAAAGPTVATHGHGHLAQLVLAAIPFAVAGTVWLAHRVQREQVVAALALLAGIQIVAFATMEAVEGLAGGADVTALVRSPRLWAGVAIQIAVALVLGFALRGAGRVAFHLLARRPPTANAHVSRPVGAPVTPPEVAEGAEVEVDVRGRTSRMRVVKPPFVPSRVR